jgi:hypothetical protein
LDGTPAEVALDFSTPAEAVAVTMAAEGSDGLDLEGLMEVEGLMELVVVVVAAVTATDVAATALNTPP